MARLFSILAAMAVTLQGSIAYAQDNAPRKATPALWKVSDADTEVYLLGTFHILSDDVDWRSKEVADAIDRAESFWFEIESDSPKFAETAQQIAQEHGTNPEGVILSGLLSERDASALAAILTDLTIPPTALENMKPWQAFLALESLVAVAEGLEPGTGVDATILSEARARGRTVAFFETTEEQLSQFTNLPQETALDLLKTTINAWTDQRAELPTLIKAWGDGDIELVDQFMNDRLRSTSPETYKKFVVDRNERWSTRIAAMLDQPGTVLVAVGATHFAGDLSIPALLAKTGLNVERIACDTVAASAPSNKAATGVTMPEDALSKLFPDAIPASLDTSDAASAEEDNNADAAATLDPLETNSDNIIPNDDAIDNPEAAIVDAEQAVEFSDDTTNSLNDPVSLDDTETEPAEETISTESIDPIQDLLRAVEDE